MDLQAFAAAHWIIQLHALSAFAALCVGAVLMAAPKGTVPHRTLGWCFAGLMITVAVTAVWIAGLRDWRFSWIHFFVPLTLYAVTSGLIRARRRDAPRHRNAMRGLFFGGLVIPSLFAFVPGRLMFSVVFG